MEKGGKRKTALISAFVAVITLLYYFTFFRHAYDPEYLYYHALFRDLYFAPLILAGLWFGLRGALLTSLSVTVLYVPFVVAYWGRASPTDFNRVLEIVVFNAVAAVLGYISDREKAREKALRESESLAAMGRALSAVAHDMSNPLMAMGGFARLLEEKPGIDEDGRRKLGFIIKGAERLDAMMKDMLDFSRPLDLKLTKEDVNQTARDSIAMLEHKAKEKRVNIQLELSPDLPPVPFDCGRMERVFLNLVSNAIDASPEDRAVTVRTRREGDRALLEVEDHGPGIPAEHREAIFTPFFTTKKHGTGLGLAIVLKVVEAHGGEIKVLQSSESGALFRVSLPLYGSKKTAYR